MKKNIKISDIVGLGVKIEKLSDSGMIPREIRENLKNTYSSNEIPSIVSIYNYLNKIKKLKSRQRVNLTGNIRTDVNLVLNEFDNLIDAIYEEYEITKKDKKHIFSDVAFFKSILRSFLEEALESHEKYTNAQLFFKQYVCDAVILPALMPYPEAYSSFLKAIDKVVNVDDEELESIVRKYSG